MTERGEKKNTHPRFLAFQQKVLLHLRGDKIPLRCHGAACRPMWWRLSDISWFPSFCPFPCCSFPFSSSLLGAFYRTTKHLIINDRKQAKLNGLLILRSVLFVFLNYRGLSSMRQTQGNYCVKDLTNRTPTFSNPRPTMPPRHVGRTPGVENTHAHNLVSICDNFCLSNHTNQPMKMARMPIYLFRFLPNGCLLCSSNSTINGWVWHLEWACAKNTC